MKRSEINAAIQMAKAVLGVHGFYLPPFAYWTADDWSQAGPECNRIKANDLGWSVTDFGRNDFDTLGVVMFTLRNGNHANPDQGTPYAEKVMVLKPGQRVPLHFHWSKTEDVINRGGGILVMELYNAKEDNSIDRVSPIRVFCDGIERTFQAGEIFEIQPGESITLTPRLFHRFWAKEAGGILVCGEVSLVSDARADNYFGEPAQRFMNIEEDEAPLHYLSNE